jgi:predicted O-methyltransferase YrrM
MNNKVINKIPKQYRGIESETKKAGFTMASDVLTGSLLRTLVCAKPGSKVLELGTGTGLSTSWLLDGMDSNSSLISVDYDARFLQIASKYLGADHRLTLVESDGGEWIEKNRQERFDFIFADTWHGKYFLLNEAIEMLNKGGIYFIDDMLPQPNWPEGHDLKVQKLIEDLEQRDDIVLTKLSWSTGIILAVKK